MLSSPGVQRYLSGNTNTNAWLASPAEKEIEVKPSFSLFPASGFFSHIPTNQSHWLMGQQRSASPSRSINLQDVVKGDHSEWLRSGSSTLTEKSTHASPLDSVRQAYSRMRTADWLLGGERKDGLSASSDKSWTICSTESSLSSTSSLQSGGQGQVPLMDVSAWIYQKSL